MEKNRISHLIGVEDILDIVKLVLVSGYLKNYKPLSLVIAGKAGNGKTDISEEYISNTAYSLSDLSSTGVLDVLQEDKEIRHIIIPDFTKVTMKQRSTSNNLMTTLNSMMEEGLGMQRLKNTKIDMRVNGKKRNCGLITSITDLSMGQNKRKFSVFGFSSRFITASFDYTDITKQKILESIYHSYYLKDALYKIELTNTKDKKIKPAIVELPYELAKELNIIGNNQFRTQKQLQCLACCSALADNRNIVNHDDIMHILRLNKFFNLNYTKI